MKNLNKNKSFFRTNIVEHWQIWVLVCIVSSASIAIHSAARMDEYGRIYGAHAAFLDMLVYSLKHQLGGWGTLAFTPISFIWAFLCAEMFNFRSRPEIVVNYKTRKSFFIHSIKDIAGYVALFSGIILSISIIIAVAMAGGIGHDWIEANSILNYFKTEFGYDATIVLSQIQALFVMLIMKFLFLWNIAFVGILLCSFTNNTVIGAIIILATCVVEPYMEQFAFLITPSAMNAFFLSSGEYVVKNLSILLLEAVIFPLVLYYRIKKKDFL